MRVPTKNIPSPVTKTTLPHTEEIEYDTQKAQTFGPMQEGKPRRPTTVNVTQRRVITDNKLRSAVRLIKQMLDARTALTPQLAAVKNYLDNKYRTSFGDAFRDAAFDVANYELDPRNHGAGSTFFGEGGQYANHFRDWVEKNLDPETANTFREMVEDFKNNAREEAKLAEAVSAYTEQKKQYNAQRREKDSEVKFPGERITETEVGEREKLPPTYNLRKNLPKVQMIGEVHPLITNLLKRGQTNEALQLIADGKGYYSELAKRLLVADVTAKTRLINANTLEMLDESAPVRDAFNTQINGLVEAVRMLAPAERQPELIAALRSENLRQMTDVFSELGTMFTEKSSPDRKSTRLNSSHT